MPKSVPFNVSASVILDAGGNGTCKVGPNVGQTWNCTIASISVTTATKVPQCSVYIGASATPENFVDGTYTGNINSTDAVANYPITPGKSVIAVWSGGDVGAVASLTVRGSQDYGN